MKKLFFFLAVMFAFSFAVSAQDIDKTITSDLNYTAKGGRADTLVRYDTVFYTLYVQDWCEYARVGVQVDSIRGALHNGTITYVQISMDNRVWYDADTITVADIESGDASVKWGISEVVLPVVSYFLLQTVATTAGTRRYKYFLLINTNKQK